MRKKRMLVSWIGVADFRAMAATMPAPQCEQVLDALGISRTEADPGSGPVKTLVDKEPFDAVHLIADRTAKYIQMFASWLDCEPKVHRVKLSNPIDYGAVFDVADKCLSNIMSGDHRTKTELCIHLSPGTPTMAAVWLLLGKSKYPARFYQTHRGTVREENIPFDLVVDLIPQVLRDADFTFHHLATRSPQEIDGFESIIGNSKSIRLAVGRTRKAALRDVPVLLLGESGTGKEMFARAIHAASQRKKGPFEAINCAAIPKELLESELFGHAKGAFTGADQARQGAFKRTDKGIIFLDEVGECEPAIQAKLLRVLQPLPGIGLNMREFQPVMASKPERSDVRIIAATNLDLLQAVGEGTFREDLYYRLAVIAIKLPPLRDRKTDISALADAILGRINKDFEAQDPGYKHKSFSASATAFVKQHDWPGNVRELQNVIVQAAVMAEKEQLSRADLAAAIQEVPGKRGSHDLLELPLGDGFDLEKHLDDIHAHYLRRAMDEAGGVKSKASSLLGMKNYQTLAGQLKRLEVVYGKRK
jgi:transcriptional regulator with PAS, ATPase and Fis domain